MARNMGAVNIHDEYSVGLPDGKTLSHVTVICIHSRQGVLSHYTAVHHALDDEGNYDDRSIRIPASAKFLPYVEAGG